MSHKLASVSCGLALALVATAASASDSDLQACLKRTHKWEEQPGKIYQGWQDPDPPQGAFTIMNECGAAVSFTVNYTIVYWGESGLHDLSRSETLQPGKSTYGITYAREIYLTDVKRAAE